MPTHKHTAGCRHDRGMTLVEILAVVVILGLVAGTLLIGFSGSFGKAKHELAKSGIGMIVSQLEKYRLEKGSWPGNELGLAVLTDGQAPPTAAYYLSAGQLRDPWDRQYHYVIPGPNGHPYEILTYGADGQPGGPDGSEDADISSTNLRGEAGS
ncbi:MAG: type II secretion system protein GspG [Phycisphaerales bacterium]|nr:type II secretion system protein GspG [Phycisphaerales bacterium]